MSWREQEMPLEANVFYALCSFQLMWDKTNKQNQSLLDTELVISIGTVCPSLCMGSEM